ncbi:hypothetical protein BC829DRAFT_420545 [Chytridium lagenaria]|nr:hypothetical protein BC829DRAFT_420545 [Chytridium lagenaria]
MTSSPEEEKEKTKRICKENNLIAGADKGRRYRGERGGDFLIIFGDVQRFDEDIRSFDDWDNRKKTVKENNEELRGDIHRSVENGGVPRDNAGIFDLYLCCIVWKRCEESCDDKTERTGSGEKKKGITSIWGERIPRTWLRMLAREAVNRYNVASGWLFSVRPFWSSSRISLSVKARLGIVSSTHYLRERLEVLRKCVVPECVHTRIFMLNVESIAVDGPVRREGGGGWLETVFKLLLMENMDLDVVEAGI